MLTTKSAVRFTIEHTNTGADINPASSLQEVQESIVAAATAAVTGALGKVTLLATPVVLSVSIEASMQIDGKAAPVAAPAPFDPVAAATAADIAAS